MNLYLIIDNIMYIKEDLYVSANTFIRSCLKGKCDGIFIGN